MVVTKGAANGTLRYFAEDSNGLGPVSNDTYAICKLDIGIMPFEHQKIKMFFQPGGLNVYSRM